MKTKGELLIYFDGTYRLKPKEGGTAPIRKWKNAWRIRIIDLGMSRPDIQYLRPKIVVAVRIGGHTLTSTCAGSLGHKICNDFDLNTDEILWVEQLNPDENRFHAAAFVKKPYQGGGFYDSVTWRPILPNEIDAIKPFIPEVSRAK
ncbi:MAG: hypothetical protein C4530_16035 [Desulfobacteraceae bacterium]|nr:MAG: hypothetical protein C4530_16035 [Desulfobacteraceae bacterium]